MKFFLGLFRDGKIPRLLEIVEAGLVDYWDVWFRPMPPQCQQNIKSAKPVDSKTLKKKDKPPALTLRNLTGAFIVLLIGLSFSFLTFLGELIISIPNRQSRQKAGSISVNVVENTRDEAAVNDEMENDIQDMNTLNGNGKSIG